MSHPYNKKKFKFRASLRHTYANACLECGMNINVRHGFMLEGP